VKCGKLSIMTTKNLLESATLVESPQSGTWKVRLISEGKGSSGIYPPEMLEKYHSAFNNVLSFENHPGWMDGPESRNFTQIVGRVQGETWIDKDERGKVGIYANWDPDPEHRERLARYKDNLGLSIYIEGDGHINEDGEYVVDFLNGEDAFRSVDVVIAAGRGGRFEESQMQQIYAQRRAESDKTGVEASAPDGKEHKMDEKIEALTAQVTALASSVETLVTAAKTKAEEAAQVEADEKVVEERIATYEANLAAIESVRESLLPSQVKHLLAEAKNAADMTALIEQAKTLADELREDAHLVESADTGVIKGATKETKYGAWN